MSKLIGLLALWLQVAAAPLTADEIVARHVEARGGLAKLRAIHSLRLSGKTTFGNGDFVRVLEWGEALKRPLMVRDENTLQGLTSVNAFDGKEAWRVQPFSGRREPQRLPADVAKNRAQDADLEGPLVGYREKGHRVDSLGTEDVDGTRAYKLRVKLKDGDLLYGPRLLPRDSRSERAQGARRRADHRDGPGQLRASRRRLVPLHHGFRREGLAQDDAPRR